MPSYYPQPNPTKSFWIEEGPDTLKGHRTTEDLPCETDVVIIGSGYSGTSVAVNLMFKDNIHHKIIMLEARDVCSGATGRNGGHIRSFYHSGHKHFVDNMGEKAAADLIIFEHYELFKVIDLVKKFKIDCDLDIRTSCQTVEDESLYGEFLDNFYAFQNNKFIPQEIKNMVEIQFEPDLKDFMGYNGSPQGKTGPFCITAPTCSLWPYKLIISLLQRCIKKGLNLQTNTMVENIKKTSDGGWIVSTSRGEIKCQHLVCATNAWTRALLPEFIDKIVPVKGVVTHIKPTSEDSEKLKYNYYHTFPMESDYVTARKDNSIIVGGGGQTYLKFPNSTKMFNDNDDSIILEDTSNYLKNYQDRYSLTKNSTKFINDYTWSGCMAYTNDEFPFVGEMSNFGRKNLYIIAGFTGHGMPRIWSCAEYISGLVDKYQLGIIPEFFKITAERMYSKRFTLFDDLIKVDKLNRDNFSK